jgi:hypothetical protein
MDALQIALVLGALLAVATLAGFAWQNTQGSVSRKALSSLPPDVPHTLVDSTAVITLLQFSGPFCSYCAAMRGVLGAEASSSEGLVAHREIDITEYPGAHQRSESLPNPHHIPGDQEWPHCFSHPRGCKTPRGC